MPLTDGLVHLANAFAPALWLAILGPLLYRFFATKHPKRPALLAQIAMQMIALCAVQFGLLAWLGRDGTLAGYGALVAGAGSVQWLLAGGWRA